VLQALGVEISASSPAEEAQGMTLEDLLDLVAQACRPDAPAGQAEQLHAFTRGMSADASMPDEIRALGRALNAISPASAPRICRRCHPSWRMRCVGCWWRSHR